MVDQNKKNLVVTGKFEALISATKQRKNGSWVDELAKCFHTHCRSVPSVSVSVESAVMDTRNIV